MGAVLPLDLVAGITRRVILDAGHAPDSCLLTVRVLLSVLRIVAEHNNLPGHPLCPVPLQVLVSTETAHVLVGRPSDQPLWHGHVVALVGETLVDASIDQASPYLGGVVVSPIVRIITPAFLSGESLSVSVAGVNYDYQACPENVGFLDTPAWLDPAWASLAQRVLSALPAPSISTGEQYDPRFITVG